MLLPGLEYNNPSHCRPIRTALHSPPRPGVQQSVASSSNQNSAPFSSQAWSTTIRRIVVQSDQRCMLLPGLEYNNPSHRRPIRTALHAPPRPGVQQSVASSSNQNSAPCSSQAWSTTIRRIVVQSEQRSMLLPGLEYNNPSHRRPIRTALHAPPRPGVQQSVASSSNQNSAAFSSQAWSTTIRRIVVQSEQRCMLLPGLEYNNPSHRRPISTALHSPPRPGVQHSVASSSKQNSAPCSSQAWSTTFRRIVVQAEQRSMLLPGLEYNIPSHRRPIRTALHSPPRPGGQQSVASSSNQNSVACSSQAWSTIRRISQPDHRSILLQAWSTIRCISQSEHRSILQAWSTIRRIVQSEHSILLQAWSTIRRISQSFQHRSILQAWSTTIRRIRHPPIRSSAASHHHSPSSSSSRPRTQRRVRCSSQ